MKEEKKNVKNSGSDSFLFSIFQRLIRPRDTGQAETPETVLDIKGKAGVSEGGRQFAPVLSDEMEGFRTCRRRCFHAQLHI